MLPCAIVLAHALALGDSPAGPPPAEPPTAEPLRAEPAPEEASAEASADQPRAEAPRAEAPRAGAPRAEAAAAVALAPGGRAPQEDGWRLNPRGRWFALRASAELGFVGVLRHGIQFGEAGTYFDFRKEGGQDVLFPFFRFTGEFAIKERHTLVFLIQPLKLQSSATIDRDVQVDGTRFAAGTPMSFKYDFGFYRFGYMYDLLRAPQHELGVGVALQIRNATIDFASRDGEQLASNRNIGVVPLLKLRGRWTPRRGQGVWLGAEIDGAYIRGRVISGTRDYFVGALVDASLRVGFEVPRAGDVFVNVRYVGGGARGTDSTPKAGKDGYAENWLHTMALSLGLYIR